MNVVTRQLTAQGELMSETDTPVAAATAKEETGTPTKPPKRAAKTRKVR